MEDGELRESIVLVLIFNKKTSFSYISCVLFVFPS
jgi:hypothetical protein